MTATIDTAQRYPLTWPSGRPRRPTSTRMRGKFYGHTKSQRHDGTGVVRSKREVTLAEATTRVEGELKILGAQRVILSTNVVLNRDGSPRSGLREPDDPGVAVWFEWGGKPYVFACDTYTRVADNVAALAAHIDAVRTSERHGVAGLEQSFTGFLALPPASKFDWRVRLGFLPHGNTPTRDEIREAHRRLALTLHPDREGGDADLMAELNRARDEGLAEVSR